MKRITITLASVLLTSLSVLHADAGLPAWQETVCVFGNNTHVVPSLWAEMPKLNAKTTVTILNVDGPGVVTTIHASALGTDFGKGFASQEAQGVMIRVFYDGESTPSIDMPFMDFLGDIQCKSAYFTTVYTSKVKESHNFRLPMPFRKHIKIEVENPSDKNLIGYADLQWEQVASLPKNCGYLRTDYRNAKMDPQQATVLFNINHPAKIVAHWLQYESEKSKGGETICEANQELYLDGDHADAELLGHRRRLRIFLGFQGNPIRQLVGYHPAGGTPTGGIAYCRVALSHGGCHIVPAVLQVDYDLCPRSGSAKAARRHPCHLSPLRLLLFGVVAIR